MIKKLFCTKQIDSTITFTLREENEIETVTINKKELALVSLDARHSY